MIVDKATETNIRGILALERVAYHSGFGRRWNLHSVCQTDAWPGRTISEIAGEGAEAQLVPLPVLVPETQTVPGTVEVAEDIVVEVDVGVVALGEMVLVDLAELVDVEAVNLVGLAEAALDLVELRVVAGADPVPSPTHRARSASSVRLVNMSVSQSEPSQVFQIRSFATVMWKSSAMSEQVRKPCSKPL